MKRAELKQRLHELGASERRRAAEPVAIPLSFVFEADRAGVESQAGVRFRLPDGSVVNIRYDAHAAQVIVHCIETPAGLAPSWFAYEGREVETDDTGAARVRLALEKIVNVFPPAKITLHKRAMNAGLPSRGSLAQLGELGTESFAEGTSFVFDDGATATIRHDGQRLFVSDLGLPPDLQESRLVLTGDHPALLLPTDRQGEFAAPLPREAIGSCAKLFLVLFARPAGKAPAEAPSGMRRQAASAPGLEGDLEFVILETDWARDAPCTLLVGGAEMAQARLTLLPNSGWRKAELPKRDAGWVDGAFVLIAGHRRVEGLTLDGEFWVREPDDAAIGELTGGMAFDLVRE